MSRSSFPVIPRSSAGVSKVGAALMGLLLLTQSLVGASDWPQFLKEFEEHPTLSTWQTFSKAAQGGAAAGVPLWLRSVVEFNDAREARDFPNSMARAGGVSPTEYQLVQTEQAKAIAKRLVHDHPPQLWELLETMALQRDDLSLALTGLELTGRLSQDRFKALAQKIRNECPENVRAIDLAKRNLEVEAKHE